MGDESLQGLHITLYGLVQGIGFRPFVARLAQVWGIDGSVSNQGGAVSIKAYAPFCRLQGFLLALHTDLPQGAQVVHMASEALNPEDMPISEGFSIVESMEEGDGPVLLPPDLPVCQSCLDEMKNPQNRRYRHPFISCTHCGPRYSIMRTVPYDRDTTSMDVFPMCSACEAEYRNSEDLRFHAQTVSCHHCGPQLVLKVPGKVGSQGEEALLEAVRIIREEGIVAVKGIGGYHLVCSPWSDKAILRLRQLKAREQKPFAVCFPDLESIRKQYACTHAEADLLQSQARPIVLLPEKSENLTPFSPYLSQSSRYLGAFLPYTPILARLTEELGPLVATSFNLTDSPILFRDADAETFESPFLGGILTHGREIVTGQDDSVAWVIRGQAQLIRRSRGYTPLPVYVSAFGDKKSGPQVFAAGGQLKSSFCLMKGPFAYMSQYMGELDTQASLEAYAKNYDHMKTLLRFKPDLTVCDLHPDYASTAFAREMGVALLPVQHHHAHIASVMAEWGKEGPMIGVAFDGTGYGEDGAVWGGEFLICEKEHYERAGHLKYTTMLNGDESMKDAAKTALCYLAGLKADNVLDDARYDIVSKAVANKINTHASSSMGRLFDAVSAILGFSRYNRYEAEAAILLENAAAKALEDGMAAHFVEFNVERDGEMLILNPDTMLRTLIKAYKAGISPESLALGFHKAVIGAVAGICGIIKEKTGIAEVALSGGVFQNRLIAEGVFDTLEQQGFTVLTGKMAPPNDSGISLGQAYIGMTHLKSRSSSRKEE